MGLAPNTIKPPRGARHTSKRLGRGNSSGKGTSSGRGTKGQKARSGGKRGTDRLGFKPSLQKIPKLRGFRSAQPKKQTITLATLERIVSGDSVITPQLLKQKGVISRPEYGVKILASGQLTKKVTVNGCVASKKAMEAIEKAGGSLTF